jgi:hypothetical protein
MTIFLKHGLEQSEKDDAKINDFFFYFSMAKSFFKIILHILFLKNIVLFGFAFKKIRSQRFLLHFSI